MAACSLLQVTDSPSERVVAAPVGRIAEEQAEEGRVAELGGDQEALPPSVDVAPG